MTPAKRSLTCLTALLLLLPLVPAASASAGASVCQAYVAGTSIATDQDFGSLTTFIMVDGCAYAGLFTRTASYPNVQTWIYAGAGLH